MLEDRPWNSSGTRCCSVRVDGVYALHASKRRGAMMRALATTF